ncbi:hypothetical protein I79_003258 [Cricetulus griseus]|uniref:Uncharacterized protein n=1 Tax=Cricetulus griseus TaxID=10029 RepID=G3GZF8_CRIGR|nr:hypothetical protein I79_003258 [Cricetulus griseus]
MYYTKYFKQTNFKLLPVPNFKSYQLFQTNSNGQSRIKTNTLKRTSIQTTICDSLSPGSPL